MAYEAMFATRWQAYGSVMDMGSKGCYPGGCGTKSRNAEPNFVLLSSLILCSRAFVVFPVALVSSRILFSFDPTSESIWSTEMFSSSKGK
jgi:hypothetical protein